MVHANSCARAVEPEFNKLSLNRTNTLHVGNKANLDGKNAINMYAFLPIGL